MQATKITPHPPAPSPTAERRGARENYPCTGFMQAQIVGDKDSMLKKLRGGLFIGLGYMLSPLSWWNDLFFNLPIAYLFGYLVSWFASDWFLPAIAVGYWISNVLGIVMMQMGAVDMFFEQREKNLKKDLLIGFGTSTAYTLVVLALMYFHVLELPVVLANQ